MNLKIIHFVLILASAFVAFLFAGWEFSNYRALGGTDALLGAVASALVGVGLLIYGVMFLRKSRKLIL